METEEERRMKEQEMQILKTSLHTAEKDKENLIEEIKRKDLQIQSLMFQTGVVPEFTASSLCP